MVNVPLAIIGVVFLGAAAVGGGLKAMNFEIGIIASSRRQLFLAFVGVVALALAFLPSMLKSNTPSSSQAQVNPTVTSGTSQGSNPAAPASSKCSSQAEFLDQQPFQSGNPPSARGLVNVDGQYFSHGLQYYLAGTTSSNPGQSIYDLGGCFNTFRAVIGFDANQVQGFSGGAQFQVVADGSVVFSDQFSRGGPICEVSVSIQGVSSLELNTWFVGVEPLYATWGDVRVFKNQDIHGTRTFPLCGP